MMDRGVFNISRVILTAVRFGHAPAGLYMDRLFRILLVAASVTGWWAYAEPAAQPEELDRENVVVDLTPEERNWIAGHPVIRLGIDPEFAPFEYISDKGVYSGIASDYISILNERLGLHMLVAYGLSWDDAVEKAERKELDVLPVVGETEERKKYFKYTRQYIEFHRVIITNIDKPFITSLDDIEDQKVAVQVNSSHEGYLRENTDISAIEYESLQEALLAVADGKVDAFVGNLASSVYWIRKLNLTNLKVAAPVSGGIKSLHFAVRDDWPELVGILQKGLDSISDYERRKIAQRWVLVKYDPVMDYSLVFMVAAVFSLLMAVVILWNLMLNRKVKQRTSQLLHQAHYDQLTGLPNRFLLLDRLAQLIKEARKQNRRVAVLSVDLDDFKKINDTLSHKVGDELLKMVAARLQKVLRDEDTLARHGGDEFVILVGGIEDASSASSYVEALLNSFREPFVVDGRELAVTASIGVSVYPDDGHEPETLLKNADSAMHHSKTQGHDTYAFYTDSLNQRVARRLQVEEYMHGALERGEFYTVFQPKVNVGTGDIVGFEALLRWHSPELGDVSPETFIPIAESNSLIEPIGLFVLREALDAVVSWRKQFDGQLTMAVNLSPRQFLSRDLLADIRTSIEQAGADSSMLEFEITENMLLSGNPAVKETFDGLKALGISLAMDDFGTGYSSMRYLRKYVFDTLKIDKEFVHDLSSDQSDSELVIATIAMAHGMGMKVVAEGVENETQLKVLVEQGCDLAQGYLFSRPERFELVTEVLLSRQRISHASA